MALQSDQQQVLNAILKIGRKRGATPKEIKAAIETGLVESNLRNLSGGDADSAGWRQERASLYADPTNLSASVNRFFDETAAVRDKYGRAGDLAAAVQRPAAQYRGRYQDRSSEAQRLLGGAGASSGSGGTTRTTTTTTPGVDNKAARAQLVLSFLNQKGGDPVAFATQARALRDIAPTTSTRTQQIGGGADTTGARDAGTTGSGQFKVTGPQPGRLKPELVSFARKVAGVYGGPLEGLDGSSHSRLTVNGNVSEHSTGNATDIFKINGKPAQGAALLHAGRAALIAAGMPREQAMKAQGGLYNVGRHQIIFLTNEGGDHFDHLHISTHAR